MIKILGYAPAGAGKIDLPGLVQTKRFSAAALDLWHLCLQENGHGGEERKENFNLTNSVQLCLSDPLDATKLLELEQFTNSFLKYFLESDLRSVNFKLPRYA